ncbi:MAG TPA: ABC transporter permease [Gaiellaceae bacterium]|jgi:ABC-type dipeptide/oligopeptide/nickel transport system permease subunit|nr:ABC transporter permease [Gaiellaceae bacterium]
MASVAPETSTAVETAGIALEHVEIEGKSPRQLFWERFRKDRAAVGSLIFIVVLTLLAVFAGVISSRLLHHGPNELFQAEMLDDFGLPKGPNRDFLLGADLSGRDVFVRILYGARASLEVALVATFFAVVIGTIVGIVGGYFRGFTDTLVSRVIDIILALPLLLFAIGIVAACGSSREGCLGGYIEPGKRLVIFVIALFSWPYIARIIRGSVLSIREKEFIEASRSLGASNVRIMSRDVLPNLVAPIIIYTTLLIPSNILFEAALSFLGLGLPPSEPSWGQMLSDASGAFDVAWWIMLFPGLFLIATVLAFNLLGDGLRDALDPRTGR